MRYSLTICVVLAGLGCAQPAAHAEIVIGFANPLSGPYAASGARNLLAVMEAVEQVNGNGGVLGEPLRLEVADDQCGMQQAIGAAETLIRAGVVMVVGHLCSHSSLLAAAVYDLADVIMITPDSTHARLTEEGRPNVFRLIGRDDTQGARAAELIAARWPTRRVAIVHDGGTYGQGLALATRRGLRRRGIDTVLFEQFDPAREEYSALVERFVEAEVEVLYIGGYGPEAGRIVAQARAAGLEPQVIGGDGLGMDGFRATAGKAAEGTLFSTLSAPDDAATSVPNSATGENIAQEFREGGLGAYAAVELWAAAVDRAGSLATKDVATMLHRGHFDTFLGTVSFDDKGDLNEAGWSWRVWRDGVTVSLD